MSICVKLTAPVALLVVVTLVIAGTPVGQTLEPQQQLAVLAVAGVLAIGAVLTQAFAFTNRLTGFAELTRATAWGERKGAFPGAGSQDEFGQAARDLSDLAMSMHDLIEQRAEMERLAMTDQLTGLPNRRGMFRLFDQLEERGQGAGDPDPLGILHIDIDHFKAVNDRFGHEAGDYVLQQAARLIASAIRDSDAIARLGGDEFVVIAPGVESERTLIRIADRIVTRFKEPVIYNDRVCEIGASIGVVLGGQRGRVSDPARLLLNADIALCQAKADGRSGYALFDTVMARTQRQLINCAEEIGKALNEEAFEPFFQPMVGVQTGQVVALETLARWRRPGYGPVAAEDFIEAADAHAMLEDLGLQVLEKTCSLIASRKLQGLTTPMVHFNVSRTQLLGASVVDSFDWTVDNHGVDPSEIAIKVSEKALTGRGSELTMANLKRLTERGFKLVLDDFGAGGGAIDVLAALPVTAVKLGPAVTAPVSTNDASAAKMRSIRALAAEFDLTLIAKMVESETHFGALSGQGIQAAQGRHVADAMSADDLERWLAGLEDSKNEWRSVTASE